MAKTTAKQTSEVITPEITVARDFISVPIDRIIPGTNIRKDFGDLTELIESVKLHGILEPVLVQGDKDGRYHLLAGGRRYKAAVEAGLKEIPVLAYNDPAPIFTTSKIEMQFIENFHRKELNPIEEAEAFQLMIDFGTKQKNIAKMLGLSQPYVANRLRLLDVDERMLNLLSENKITPSHILEILKFKNIVPKLIFEEMVDCFIDRVDTPDCNVSVSFIGTPEFYTAKFSDSDPEDDSWISFQHKMFDKCKSCEFYFELGYTRFCKNSDCYKKLRKEFDDQRLKEFLEKKNKSGNDSESDEIERQEIVKKQIKSEKFSEFYNLISDQVIYHLDDVNRPADLIKKSLVYFVRNNNYFLKSRYNDYYCSVIGEDFSRDNISDYTDSQILNMFIYSILMDKIDIESVYSHPDYKSYLSVLLDMGIFLPKKITEFDFSIPDVVDISLPLCNKRSSTEIKDVFECNRNGHRVLFSECLDCGGNKEEV